MVSVESLWSFLVAHAYAVVFAVTLIDATGTPFPGRLLLIAAGSLAAAGKASITALIALAAIAAVLGDHVWYVAGRFGGERMLALYCRVVTLGSRRCVEKAKRCFERFGPAAIIVGRFVAGVRIFVTPIAATSGMPYLRYLAYDAVGAFVWAALWIVVGFVVGERWQAWTQEYGSTTVTVAMAGAGAAGLLGVVGYRFTKRWRHGGARLSARAR